MKRNLLLMVWLVLITISATAQTNIGGVINTYTSVTSISNCSCPSSACATISVASTTGFSIGDKILIIQMKGAAVDTTNTQAHGSIDSLYDAGNYEVSYIDTIIGDVITTDFPLRETYFTGVDVADSAYVQLVRVPVYTGNVNVTTDLRPAIWNGSTGGVLAFEVEDTLTLSANISADTMGFRAAPKVQSVLNCGDDTAFYYQSTIWDHDACKTCGYAYDDPVTRIATVAKYGPCGSPCHTNRLSNLDLRVAGFRGEGIAAMTFIKTFSNGNVAWFNKGRGRWGNGGGGGGNHNGGGGGGGNYGSGGFGGNAYNKTSGGGACPAGTLHNRRGYGGAPLTPTGSRIFMGGGGGEGHDNGTNGSTGNAGAGIIIIEASVISNPSSYKITANGGDVSFVAFGDGSGGGGAGGTVMLDIANGFEDATTITAYGGQGGDHNNSNCHGTGGGGGGGVIWFSGSSCTPANVTTDVTGGTNGKQLAASPDCADVDWGATSGGAGVVMCDLDAGALVFLNTSACRTGGGLPVELLTFSAYPEDDGIELNWQTASEINNDYFIIMRSSDGKNFEQLQRIEGNGNKTTISKYSHFDDDPYYGVNYYKLIQVDFDGTQKGLRMVAVKYNDKMSAFSIFPNPAKDIVSIQSSRSEAYDLELTDVTGRVVAQKSSVLGITTLYTDKIPNGIYYVKVYDGRTIAVDRLVVKH